MYPMQSKLIQLYHETKQPRADGQTSPEFPRVYSAKTALRLRLALSIRPMRRMPPARKPHRYSKTARQKKARR